MKKHHLFSAFTVLLLMPATVFLGRQLPGRSYYLTSTLLALEAMLPFFLCFEARKPQARELVLLAVMCALSIAARVVIPFPSFKPTTAIIMLSGIAFGPEAGFLSGAVSAFASNFFFSQGPWTPWQMLSYGISGFLAGVFFHKKAPQAIRSTKMLLKLSLFSFFCILMISGPLLDCSTLFTISSVLTKKYVLAVFAAGLPHNLSHGTASAVTMLLFARPLLQKLGRMQQKYGIGDW